MTVSQNLHHRRAAAAAVHRRAPAPAPQLGFDPGDPFGGLSDLFPNRPTPTSDDLPTSTPSSTASSTASSTSSSSSSSSTSTTPTSTTPSSTIAPTTSAPPATTTAQSKLVLTTALPQTSVVTVTRSTSSVPVATSSAAALDSNVSSGISTGVVVGGIGAGVVAIGVIGFAIAYYIRRARNRENDQFDSHNFRRSAMLMEDPPTHDDTVARGFNPRPPTMIERHLASPAPTFGTQYGHPGPGYNQEGEYAGGYSENMAGYGTSFQSFAPGQVINANNGYPSPITATSAHPMYNGAAYTQSPFSPIGSSPEEYHDNGLTRRASMGSGSNHPSYPEAAPYPAPAPVLTRQGSNGEAQRRGSPTALERENVPANDYVDLNRSSVSPYQAAQYVEISRRLNTEVPEGLPSADIDRELPPVPTMPGVSPFADPSSAPPSPGGQYAVDRREFGHDGRPVSGESTHTLEFPAPPSPIHAPSATRYRIDSTPPTLPEIHVESRVSVGGYPVLTNRDTIDSQQNTIVGGLSTGTGSRFPTTPSPLASSFGFPSPAPNATSFSPTHPKIPTPPSAFSPANAAAANGGAPNNFQDKRTSMHSLYNDEDAYGGM